MLGDAPGLVANLKAPTLNLQGAGSCTKPLSQGNSNSYPLLSNPAG